MSQLVVIAFDTTEEATQVRDSLRQVAKQGRLSLDDTAIVVKDADGKVHIDNQVSHGTMVGTGIGALLGVLLASVFFPIGGLILGAAGGALVARMADLGVDGKFVKDVAERMQPGTSALFVLGHGGDPSAVMGVLRNYKGTVLQTTLSSEVEENLRKALGDTTQA